jgi:hypothetical protein
MRCKADIIGSCKAASAPVERRLIGPLSNPSNNDPPHGQLSRRLVRNLFFRADPRRLDSEALG